MELGMIGLGRMGGGLVERLLAQGHGCVVHDRDGAKIAALEALGARGATTVDELRDEMLPPRAVWVMVPAAVTGDVVDVLATVLEPGDTVVDGGNSYYRDDIVRAELLARRGIDYVDVGTSGGVHGLGRGFCLMVGGTAAAVARLAPVFESLAPEPGAAARTPGRSGDLAPEERGWLHCGPAGAGHFVKMVHNGIEYGMMAALAEGLAVLDRAGVGREGRPEDAETAPLRDAWAYPYELDLAAIAELWRRGSVISSWLVDLAAAALHTSPGLDGLAGRVADSGEGRWTVQAAVDEGVPVPVLSAALFGRFTSRGHAELANRVLSALRREFGGHEER